MSNVIKRKRPHFQFQIVYVSVRLIQPSTHPYTHARILEIRTYEWARVHRETVGFFDFANFGLKEIGDLGTHSTNRRTHFPFLFHLMLAACVYLFV